MVEVGDRKLSFGPGGKGWAFLGGILGGLAVLGSLAAFFWAVNGIAVAPSAYPVAVRVQKIALSISILIGFAWFCFVLYGRAVEWTRPASRVSLQSREEQALLSLFCFFLGLMVVANYLPEVVWLINHRAWLKVLAVGPYALVALYVFVRGAQIVIRDWRHTTPVA